MGDGAVGSIILIDASDRNGPVVGIALVKPSDGVMLITSRGQTIRLRVDEIRETGRNAQGVKLMRIDDDERVVAIESIGDAPDENGVEPSLAPEADLAGGDDAAEPESESGAAPENGASEAGDEEEEPS